ncbi:uncharacterized protein [Mytilus edulis]|uniref:uncharacterized protein n=1 Tax=Mytilus edulis TaxID=6550 RepID=UPI0039EEB1B1
MLFCFGLFALLLYNTVVANAVCSFTYSKKDKINAISSDYQQKGYERKCEYVITAPKNSYIIQLNFTDLVGFKTLQSSTSFTPAEELTRSDTVQEGKNCLPPELIIKERTLKGIEIKSRTICNYDYKLPQVFHYKSNFVKIIFVWVKNARSGFKLDIDFQKSNECEIYCDESKCLDSLVCKTTSAPSLNDVQSLGASPSTPISKIVVIIVIVVLMPVLAVFICVVCPCRSTARMLRRWRSRDRGVEHRQLRPQSQGSEVVYVPSTSSTGSTNQDNIEHQTALLRERNIIMQSAQTSVQLPPHIPISKDGEEGYIESQNKLERHRRSDYQICFRPPPNKTVYDKDSPPPYSSRSTSSIDSIGQAKNSNLVTDNNSGCPVLRCYSMSENNNHSCFQQPQQFNRTSVSSRQLRQTTRNTGVNMDRPPDYPGGVLGTNVYHNSAAPAKNSV